MNFRKCQNSPNQVSEGPCMKILTIYIYIHVFMQLAYTLHPYVKHPGSSDGKESAYRFDSWAEYRWRRLSNSCLEKSMDRKNTVIWSMVRHDCIDSLYVHVHMHIHYIYIRTHTHKHRSDYEAAGDIDRIIGLWRLMWKKSNRWALCGTFKILFEIHRHCHLSDD